MYLVNIIAFVCLFLAAGTWILIVRNNFRDWISRKLILHPKNYQADRIVRSVAYGTLLIFLGSLFLGVLTSGGSLKWTDATGDLVGLMVLIIMLISFDALFILYTLQLKVRPSTGPCGARPPMRRNVGQFPPADWSDVDGWNRYLTAESGKVPFRIPMEVRFLNFARDHGGRVWFPGCGTDPVPRLYAYLGCAVMATDFSSVAVQLQRQFADLAPQTMFADWQTWIEASQVCERPNCRVHSIYRLAIEKSGRFDVAEHDFVAAPPPGVFDVVINCRAFQGLSRSAMRAAAMHFFAALRPGGAAFIDTINVQGRARDIEDSLVDGGFFLPFSASNRWYRDQLDSTGIPYGMVLGRPLVRYNERYPYERFKERAARDREVLSSFRTEYEKRIAAEESFVKLTIAKPETIVAYVIYNTG